MSNEMLNKPEFSDMIEEESEKLEKNVDQMFLDMIGMFRTELRRLDLNTDDCHELTTKLKEWFIWCQR